MTDELDNKSASASADEAGEESVFKVLLPYLIATVALSVALTLGLVRFLPRVVPAAPAVVSFDVLKYINAQRAVAGNVLSFGAKTDDTQLFLLEVGKRTQEAIRRKAGPNTLILVKQSVVSGGEIKDITDEVLADLGLPTQVPTQDFSKFMSEEAPTMMGFFGTGAAPRSEGTAKGKNAGILP